MDQLKTQHFSNRIRTQGEVGLGFENSTCPLVIFGYVALTHDFRSNVHQSQLFSERVIYPVLKLSAKNNVKKNLHWH